MSKDIFVVHPSAPVEYKKSVPSHDNGGFDEVDGSTRTYTNNSLQVPEFRSHDSSRASSRCSNGTVEKHTTFRTKLCYGLMIVALFLGINVTVIMISLHKYDSLENKLAMVSEKIDLDEKAAEESLKTIEMLKRDSKSLRESVDTLNILQRFTYVGRGYGINRKGEREWINNDTLSSQVECLLFCYQHSLSNPAINAVSVIVDNDDDCYCDINSVNMTKYDGAVHYVYSNPVNTSV